ncbi:MAG TPA: sugar porter family MFS transporter [Pedobacter sp.]|uniref:sugar porter family MFS transporter n=1 Tax=Pedobacter sp. TaxID=1411316 RepID=UPI002B85D0D8|nr:sugar porter family MFS transporter [Pedobacter sp.]HMI01399.1 sugar porter family MFS transporter [Pedobacter sp.]
MALILLGDLPSAAGDFTYNRNYIYLVSAVAALGGLLFGFDLAIISGTIHFFTVQFQLNELQTGLAVGCINIGAAIGALCAGKLSDDLGRKKLLIISAILFAITGVGTGWAGDFPIFIIFRLFSGIAIGLAAMVCPMYIAEMSPAALRGRLVAFYQLAITLGILLAYLSNYLLLDTGQNNWRWMFSSQSVPALLFFFGLLFVSESPRWLIRKHHEKEGMRILERIGGTVYAAAECQAIRRSFSREIKENIRDLFKEKTKKAVVIGIMIAVFSQITLGPVFAYGPEIFKQANVAEDTAFLQSVILGLITLIFTFVAILTIDKAGRKKLLLYGSALLCINGVAIAISFYLALPGYWILCFVLGAVAIYSATLGPVTWVLLSEIFPNRIRGNAMSLATLSLWISSFLALSFFPVMKSSFGMPLTFGIHAAVSFICFLFVQIKIPETKGKSLEEIELFLNKKSSN